MSATDQDQERNNQQYQSMLSRFTKILVIGLGQLGLPVVKYVKERGFDAYGYDISTNQANPDLNNEDGSITDLIELVSLAKRGVIRPIISNRFKLEQATALTMLKNGKILGRGILNP